MRNTWRDLPTDNALAARSCHLACWMDDSMFVWAGVSERGAFSRGATYNPKQKQWRPFRIDLPKLIPRTAPTVWTGTEVLWWGGINGGHKLADGIRWDPKTQKARALPTKGAPSARSNHAAIWTGSELVIWGGRPLGDGARYDPRADQWRPMTTKAAPDPKSGPAFTWNGSELLVVGGCGPSADLPLREAWAWHPEAGWRPLPDLPAGRTDSHAIWTPTRLLILGGSSSGGPHSGGFSLAAELVGATAGGRK